MESGEGVPVLGMDVTNRWAMHVAAQFDAPAYVRRSQRYDAALSAIDVLCAQKRDRLLLMPRIHLGSLREMVGAWDDLTPLLTEGQLVLVQELQATIQPSVLALGSSKGSTRARLLVLKQFAASLQVHNKRWLTFLGQIDLQPVNQAVRDYNRYYVLEKECLVHSPILARRGFVPLREMDVAGLLERWPLLPVPELRS